MKILKVVFGIIIILSFLLVGTPIKYNCLELNIVIIIIGTIFIIYKTLVKKERVITRKIDIIMLLFLMSPIIPLLFDTYSSLQETLISIVKYISLFNIYIIAKEIINTEENFIANLFICVGIVLALLGIDEMTAKLIFKYTEFIGLPYVVNYENRMFSTLGYANSFAIIMAIELFISIDKTQKGKEIYSGTTFIFLSALLLSNSRSVLVIFICIFLLYVVLNKNKEKIYNIYVFIINLILAFMYMRLFENLNASEQYINIWLLTILEFVVSIVIVKFLNKKIEIIYNVKIKTYLKIFAVILIILSGVYFIGKELDVPLEIFKYGNDNSEVRYNIYKIEPNKHYEFVFDIEAISKLTNVENYSIKIVEENNYYDTVETHEWKFNSFTGKKAIEFETSSETSSVAILFNSSIEIAQQGVKINSLYINGEKYVLKYLYLPTSIVKRLDNFSLENKSLWERKNFFNDGLKIIKDNYLFGTGGKGWLYNYEKIQSYVYATTEVHSFPVQIFIENGIFSIIMLIVLDTYAIIIIIKTLKKKKIKLITLAFILLLLHSCIDFDMSFYCIEVMWVILYVCTIQKENEEKGLQVSKKGKIKIKELINIKYCKYVILSTIIIVNISALVIATNAINLKEKNEELLENIDKSRNSNEIIECIKEYKTNEKYKNFYENLQFINYKNVNENNLEYIYIEIEQTKINVNTEKNISRNLVIKQILETSDNAEILTKLSKIIIDENDEMVHNIKNKEKNRLTNEKIEEYLKKQEEIYNLALNYNKG